MRNFLLLSAAAFFCLGSPAHVLLAGDFYVIPNGAPTGGDGSPGAPFGTITEALTSGAVGSGDTIHLAAGGYSNDRGEVMPLPMVDGVTLSGEDKNNTVVGAYADGPVFRLGNFVNTTVIKNMTLFSDSTAVFYITDTMQDLKIIGVQHNSEILGETFMEFSGSEATINVEMSHCCLAVNDEDVFIFDAFSGAGPHNFWIHDNVFAGSYAFFDYSGTSTVELNVHAWNNKFAYHDDPVFEIDFSNNARASINLWDNQGLNLYYPFLDFSADVSLTGQQQDFVINVHGNSQVGGQSTWVEIDVDMDQSDARCILDLNMTDNCVLAGDYPMLHLDLSADNSGSVQCDLNFQYNAAVGGTSYALEIELDVWTSAILGLDALIACNEFNHNESTGVYFDASARLSGVMNLDVLFRKNVIIGNEDYGVYVDLWTSANGVINGVPDFGTAADPGKNTIHSNDTQDPESTGTDFSFDAWSTGVTLFAVGNWWTVNSGTPIEDRIYHMPDGNDGTVDFDDPLAFPLVVSGPGAVAQGQWITVFAGADSYFIQRAGKTRIWVTFDGVPAANVQVAANCKSMRVLVPIGLFAIGPVTMVIKNPGGQIGSLALAIATAASSSGICFVATAAYGDDQAAEVRVLQRWRDECLADNAFGRQLVRAYYALSPPLAEAIAGSEPARTVSRAALAPVVGAVKLWLELPWLYGLAGAVLFLRLLRRRS